MTERIFRYLREQQPETPVLVVDLDVVEHNFRRMRELLPTAHIFYAVKANPAAQVLAHYGHVDAIPDDASKWKVPIRGAAALAESLRNHRIEVALYRTLATLREDAPLPESLEDLQWHGARREELTAFCAEIGDTELPGRVERWR